MILLYIAAGGALGAVLRYLCSLYVIQIAGDALPYGTLFVNTAGSFLLGLLYTIGINTVSFTGETRALLTIGFLGSFTTFSTFTAETVNLFQEGNYLSAGIYLTGSVILGILAVLMGMACAGFFLKRYKGGEYFESEDNGASEEVENIYR